jgi:hypothetical protein
MNPINQIIQGDCRSLPSRCSGLRQDPCGSGQATGASGSPNEGEAAQRMSDHAHNPGLPMTLANMRLNGVRMVTASCANCGRSADVNVDLLPETLTVPEAVQRLRCSQCGGKTISTRPAWHTGTPAPARQTITTNDRQCPRPATATASPAGFDAGPGLSHGDRGGLRRLRTPHLKVSGFRPRWASKR